MAAVVEDGPASPRGSAFCDRSHQDRSLHSKPNPGRRKPNLTCCLILLFDAVNHCSWLPNQASSQKFPVPFGWPEAFVRAVTAVVLQKQFCRRNRTNRQSRRSTIQFSIRGVHDQGRHAQGVERDSRRAGVDRGPIQKTFSGRRTTKSS